MSDTCCDTMDDAIDDDVVFLTDEGFAIDWTEASGGGYCLIAFCPWCGETVG